jgi:hypothetical protein
MSRFIFVMSKQSSPGIETDAISRRNISPLVEKELNLREIVPHPCAGSQNRMYVRWILRTTIIGCSSCDSIQFLKPRYTLSDDILECSLWYKVSDYLGRLQNLFEKVKTWTSIIVSPEFEAIWDRTQSIVTGCWYGLCIISPLPRLARSVTLTVQCCQTLLVWSMDPDRLLGWIS